MQARKIDDEDSEMNKDSKPKVKKGKKSSFYQKGLVDVNSASGASELVVGAENNEFTSGASRSIFGNEPTTSGSVPLKLPDAESEVRIGDRLLTKVEVDKMDSVIAAATAKAESIERDAEINERDAEINEGDAEIEESDAETDERDLELRVPKSDPLKQVRARFLILRLC